MPSGMRPRLPSSTGSARAMETCTGSRCIDFLRMGIIAETEPKTAKQTANAPVPSVNWMALPLDVSFMDVTIRRGASQRHDFRHNAVVSGELHAFLARDHERLDALLAKGAAGDLDAYKEFRAGLLWHIGVEEKILFPHLRARTGETELLGQLHRDHAALGALLMPPPNAADLASICAILESHNPLEEGHGGLYGMIDDSLLEQVRAFPPVPVGPHADSEITRASIEQLLRRRGGG